MDPVTDTPNTDPAGSGTTPNTDPAGSGTTPNTDPAGSGTTPNTDPAGSGTTPNTDPAGSGTTPTESWLSSLSEEMRSNEKLSRFSTVEELATAYANTPELPKVLKPEEYVIPEGFFMPSFGKFANEHKLSQEVVNGLSQLQDQYITESAKAASAAEQQKAVAFRNSLGDEAAQNTALATASSVIRQFDTEDREFYNEAKQAGVLNSPVLAKFLIRIGDALKEEGYLKTHVRPAKGENRSRAEILYPSQGDN